MRHLIGLVLVLFTASVAGATEKEERPAEPERAEPVVTEQAAERPQLILTPVVVEETRAAEGEEAVQDMPQRGSFWWVVGAVVVAGVILAVLL